MTLQNLKPTNSIKMTNQLQFMDRSEEKIIFYTQNLKFYFFQVQLCYRVPKNITKDLDIFIKLNNMKTFSE